MILLTAVAVTDSTVSALSAGANDNIVKPFSARELIARIESQLALADLRHAQGAVVAAVTRHAVRRLFIGIKYAERGAPEIATQPNLPEVSQAHN